MSLSEHEPRILTSATMQTSQDVVQQQKSKQSQEAVKDIAFGSVAGICGKFFEYPFDTVKVRLQSQPSAADVAIHGARGELYYTGPIDCFRKSLATGGIRSLYRGISAPLFGAAVETSSLFFSYRIAQEAICAIAYPQNRSENGSGKITLPLSALVLCGAASGAFTSLLLTPIELVKCQIQAEPLAGGPTIHKNPLSVMGAVWRSHGLLGFWRGQMGTLIRETGGSAAWFGSYEGVGALLKEWSSGNVQPSFPTEASSSSKAPTWHQLFAGACAGVSYNFLFYPADTIKSRMQTEQVDTVILAGRNAEATQRPSFWSVGRDLWHTQGLKGMYRGCGITVARSAPASAIIFTIFEWLRGTFE